jgi:hypothetical protein
VQGTQGITGSQGATGSQGTAGTIGVNGAQGTTGTTGSQGATGTTGNTGSTGSQGTTGATGNTGGTGSQGTTGATGNTGGTGSQGATGSTGSTGNTGSTGSTGATGAQGTSGATILGNNQTWTGYNTFSTPIRRSTPLAGWFEGTYNNVGDNSGKSNPIYTIGSSYNPLDAGLSNMYGIGFSHPNFWGGGKTSDWGLYVAAAGVIHATIGQSDPKIWTSGYGQSDSSWRAPIFYDSNNTGYYGDYAGTSNYNRLNLVGFDSSGRNYSREWLEFPNYSGLYSPNNGAHFHANNNGSYGSWTIRGSLNGYGGIYDLFSGVTGMMYDGSGNGGVYREANGRWFFYHNLGNNCMGINGSGTSSTYALYLNGKGLYSPARVDGTIFYDTDNTGYYVDPNSSSNIRTLTNNGWLYITENYGHSVVGVYASTIFQGVFAMGDAYKLTAGGGISNLYGMTWSYPSAGGIAGNLASHGLIVAINGGFGSCMSYNVTASGNVTAYSDERLKKDWADLPKDYVEQLAKVKVGTYTRIDGEKIRQVGVSAQSLRPLLPEAVIESNDDMKTLNVSYGNAAMASAVELAKEVVTLKQQLNIVMERLKQLENK